jgi:hypothetical protein
MNEIFFLREFCYENICFMNFLNESINNFSVIPNKNQIAINKQILEKFNKINFNNQKEYLGRLGKSAEEQEKFISEWAESNGFKLKECKEKDYSDKFYIIQNKYVLPKYLEIFDLFKGGNTDVLLLLLKYFIKNLKISIKSINNLKNEENNKLKDSQELNKKLIDKNENLKVFLNFYENHPLMKLVDVKATAQRMEIAKKMSHENLVTATTRLFEMQLEDKKEIEKLKKDINNLKMELEEANQKLLCERKDKEKLKGLTDSVKKENSDIREKNENLKAQVSSVKRENESLKVQFTSVKKELSDMREDNENLKAQVSSVKRENESLKFQFTSVKKENSDMREDNENLKAQVSSIKRENQNLKEKLFSVNKEYTILNEKFANMESRISSLENDNVKMKKEFNETLKKEKTKSKIELNENLSKLFESNNKLIMDKIAKILEEGKKNVLSKVNNPP